MLFLGAWKLDRESQMMSLDLFTSTLDPEKLHQNFRALVSDREEYARDVLRSWAEGFIDRDGKFAVEFQTSFNSCFWELYLFACFKELGYEVDLSNQSPDFLLRMDEVSFCVEATTANNPQNGCPEWDLEEKYRQLRGLNFSLEIGVNLSTIRLAQSILGKYRKYRDSYSKLEHVKGRPFVIAVAPFEQPLFFNQVNQAITRVLFAYDKLLFRDDAVTGERHILGHERMETIEKGNGTEIGLGYFTSEEMKEVSAVIFSNTATFGKVRALSKDPRPMDFEFKRFNEGGALPFEGRLPKAEYRESLLDGLQIYHNPYAILPLRFNRGGSEIAHCYYDTRENLPISEAPNNALLQRVVLRGDWSESVAN